MHEGHSQVTWHAKTRTWPFLCDRSNPVGNVNVIWSAVLMTLFHPVRKQFSMSAQMAGDNNLNATA